MLPVKLKLEANDIVEMQLNAQLMQDADSTDDDVSNDTDDSGIYRLPLSPTDLAAISLRPLSERVAAKAAREQQALTSDLYVFFLLCNLMWFRECVCVWILNADVGLCLCLCLDKYLKVCE